MSLAKTRAELRSEARAELLTATGASPGDTQEGHWSDDRLNELLNEESQAIQDEILAIQDSGYFLHGPETIVPAFNRIDLNALQKKCLHIVALGKRLGDRFVRVRVIEAGSVFDDSVWRGEETWTRIGDMLWTETPNVVGQTYALVYKFQVPPMHTDGTLCELPPRFLPILPRRVAYRALLQAKFVDQAAAMKADADERLMRMKATGSKTTEGVHRVIRDLEDYGDARVNRAAYYAFWTGG